jgi:sugar (pentulose or hexulose) kinase
VILVAHQAEMAALGVAAMAGAGKSGDRSRALAPQIDDAERAERRAAWAAAVARARPPARQKALR